MIFNPVLDLLSSSWEFETYIVVLDVTEQPEFSVGMFSMDQRLEWSVKFFNGDPFLCFLVVRRTEQKLSLETITSHIHLT